MSGPIFIRVQTAFSLTEQEARTLVKDWIDAWLRDPPSATARTGIREVSNAARHLRDALTLFENANSGDNGK